MGWTLSGLRGVVVLVLAVMTGFAQTAFAENCTLERLVEAPILPDEYFSPVIEVLIDDKPRHVLLDTGGFWSLVSPEIAASYPARHAGIDSKLGLQGLLLDHTVKIGSVQIGPAKISGVEFYVAPPNYLNFDGTLGANWLNNFDIEIDPVKNTASFFSHDHCDGGVIYWPHRDLTVVPFKLVPFEHHITLNLMLNGQKVRAMLDTGAPDTVLSLHAAKTLFGLTPDSPGVEVSGDDLDSRGRVHKTYRYRFQSLEMGEIGFKNSWITLAEMSDDNQDLILGMHQLHGLHLFFAYKEQKLYISSAQGDIAARTSAGEKPAGAIAQMSDPLARVNAKNFERDALAALKKKDVDGAMAMIDRAIEIDPTYAAGYVARAAIHAMRHEKDLANKDFDRAVRIEPTNPDIYAERSRIDWELGDKAAALTEINGLLQRNPDYAGGYELRAGYEADDGKTDRAVADMTEAIRISPSNPSGYGARAALYAGLGDYAHAYEDQTIVVKLQPKSPSALNGRCWFGALAGKLDEALDDCNAALDIAPKAAPILDSRGFVRLKRGQFERAISDYSAAIEIAPKLASSLYGRSLAKRQKGDTSGADGDAAAARAIDPDIAQHFGK
jgi:tetratricopeptide (TPR) repeat protein